MSPPTRAVAYTLKARGKDDATKGMPFRHCPVGTYLTKRWTYLGSLLLGVVKLAIAF